MTVMGNCKEACWEEWCTEGGEYSWGGRILHLPMNIKTQWNKENTRYRGKEEPSRLDLRLTMESYNTENTEYTCPIIKSDHTPTVLEKSMKEEMTQEWNHTDMKV